MKEKHIRDIRAFNRFYTDIIGLLDKYILDSHFTLPEARVLYELSRHDSVSASELIALLHIDKGYLSRMTTQFAKRKLLVRRPADDDARSLRLSLTAAGQKAFEALNHASNNEIKTLLAGLSDSDCDRLTTHMQAIKTLLLKTAQHEND